MLQRETLFASLGGAAHRPAHRDTLRGACANQAPARGSGAPIPSSGAWFPGDDPGPRQFAHIGALDLENGEHLPEVTICFETYGTLAPTGDNAVLVLHGFSADSHAARHASNDSVGWWEGMVGPGCPIDTNRYFVVVPNALGGCQGSTGPASLAPDGEFWAARFPRITTRDQVAAEIVMAHQLGVRSWALVTGPSMGGCRALEWAIMGPDAGIEVRGLAPIGASPATPADVIAWAHPQLAAIRLDPGWHGGNYYGLPAGEGPHGGMAVARSIAHNTYRSAVEYGARFGRHAQGTEEPLVDGRYAVESYLDHHGDKLARRFDANSYLTLTESINSHDVGRGRGGVEAALARITARTMVVAVDTDRLFPAQESARVAAFVPDAVGLRVIATPHGHDGFLIEFDQLGPMIAEFLTDIG